MTLSLLLAQVCYGCVLICYAYRLIIIAEKKEVYDRFPTPLINRLEKHIVDTSTVLNERQNKVLVVFKRWIEKFNDVPNYEYVCIV